jgi:FOG: Ankyrin repeat
MNTLLIPLKYVLTLLCCCNSSQNSTPQNYQVNNSQINNYPTDFINAIKNGDLEKVKTFMPAQRDFIAPYHDNPIHIAAIAGKLNIVKYLIEKQNVEVDKPSYENFNKTPLIYAIENKDKKMIRYLVRKGAILNVEATTDNQKMTPLHYAIISGNLKIIKLLIQLGAHLNLKDEYGRTTTEIAATYGKKIYLNIFY